MYARAQFVGSMEREKGWRGGKGEEKNGHSLSSTDESA